MRAPSYTERRDLVQWRRPMLKLSRAAPCDRRGVGLETNVGPVTLAPFAEEHSDATFNWLVSDTLLRSQIDSLSPPETRDENRAYWRRRRDDARRADFAILHAGRHIGNCGLSDIDRSRGKAQMWIYVALDRGSGVGEKAARTLLAHAFDEMRLQRVYLRVLASNPQALRFYARLGFRQEGLFRRDTIQKGVSIDAHALALLAEEYSAASWNAPKS